MQEIIISREIYENLKPISFMHERVCYFNHDNQRMILKKLPYNQELRDNSIYTVKALDEMHTHFSEEFVLPNNLVKCDERIVGFTTKEIINSDNLKHVLISKLPSEEKIKYLKKMGSILRKCDEIRKNEELKDFAITDLHEENVLIDDNFNFYAIDMDSVYIKNNMVQSAKYMSTTSLARKIAKYKKNDRGFIIPSRETELYNYIIIILNYLLNFDVAYMPVNDFLNMLNYLERFNFNKELIQTFYKIVIDAANENPDYLLDTITKKQVQKIYHHKFYKKRQFILFN